MLRFGSDGTNTWKDDTDVVVGFNRKALEDTSIRLELNNIMLLNEVAEIMEIIARCGDKIFQDRSVVMRHHTFVACLMLSVVRMIDRQTGDE